MNTKTILVVDDEKDIRELLKYNLSTEGYNVITANDGLDAKNKLNQDIDLFILDVMMPNIDGLELCKIIRSNQNYNHIPIIFLTAKDNEIDEIIGLEMGADDYIYKPISIHKLKARIRASLRKYQHREYPNGILKINDLVIDYNKYRVSLNSDSLDLTRNETKILFLLSRSPGKYFTRTEILDKIWNDIIVSDRTIDTHIVNLRNKLNEYSVLIETKRGLGYSLNLEKINDAK
tara:strand:- start:1291 stop:1989 length:699 start_codon:yes stop_codon:yes gene_type:complete